MEKFARSLTALAFLAAGCSEPERRETSNSSLADLGFVASDHVAPRRVAVWTPPGYAEGDAAYPVIYAHDGQNLFDPATSYGGVSWEMDEAMERLVADGKTDGAIIVGVWNTELRFREYAPAAVLDALPDTLRPDREQTYGGKPLSDAYLKFLVEELKPRIDNEFRTLPDRDNTFVAGSSMGGLISLYALTQYPDVFGGAGCLSTHWPLTLSDDKLADYDTFGAPIAAAFVEYLSAHPPSPQDHRIWFDSGTETLDAHYAPFQVSVDEAIEALGFAQGVNWVTKTYRGAAHNEAAWQARIDEVFLFLLDGDA